MGQIAIVDDSPDLLELFELILGRGSHEVKGFTDGAQFLKEFRNGRFDLVVLDLLMPVMDGYAVFRELRKRDKDVPVVAVTAKARPEEREQALRTGFCDYFVKPIVELDRFRSAIFSHVGECANPPHQS